MEDLLSKGRVDFIFPADYRAGTALESTVQNIIRKMAIVDALTEENARQLRRPGGATCPTRPACLSNKRHAAGTELLPHSVLMKKRPGPEGPGRFLPHSARYFTDSSADPRRCR